MKKTLKILFLTFILSFACMININAETKTLECKYRRNYMGDSSSKYNFDFTVTFNVYTNSYSLGHKLSQDTYSVNGKEFKLKFADMNSEISPGNSVVSWKSVSEYISENNSCPPLNFAEVYDKNIIYIFPQDAPVNSGTEVFSLTLLNSDGSATDSITSENEKVCQLSVDRLTLQKATGKTLNGDDYNNNKVYTFNVITRDDNSVFIKFYDGKSYGVKSLVAKTTTSDYAWENSVSLGTFNSKKISLKNDTVETFKNKFKYDNVTCPSIYLNYNGSRFDISLTKSDNSVEVSSDFKVEESETLKQLEIDLGFFKNVTISSEVSNCMAYVGEDLAEMLQSVFKIIKIVAIILTIVLSMIDLANVLTKDKDELMNTVKKWVKRLIIVLVILLLPTFIDLLGNIAGKEDILCGIK